MGGTVPGWGGILCGAGVAALACLVGYWPETAVWMKQNNELSSWVQAVGSVAAILASAGLAISIDQKSAARLRRDRHNESLAHFKAGCQAIRVAQMRLAEVRFAFDNAQGVPAEFDASERAAAVLTAVEMLDFYRRRGVLSPELVYANIAARITMNDLMALLQRYDQGQAMFAALGRGLPLAETTLHGLLSILDKPEAAPQVD